jgi:hypothetical protein
MTQGVTSYVKNKKIISVVYLVLQSHRISFGTNYCLKKRNMNFVEGSYVSNVGKNVQNKFHIFCVKKAGEKNSKNIIFRKTNIFF